jgi:hypothetical protein
MTNAYVVTGILTDPQTVRLSEPLPVGAGEVRVTVEVMTLPAVPSGSIQEFLAGVRRRRAEAGVEPLTPEQIEEWVRDVRDGRGD